MESQQEKKKIKSSAKRKIQGNPTEILNAFALTKSCTHVEEEYLVGLMRCEKGHENMGQMVEKVTDSDYKRYIHFLFVSKWSASDVNLVTMKSTG